MQKNLCKLKQIEKDTFYMIYAHEY